MLKIVLILCLQAFCVCMGSTLDPAAITADLVVIMDESGSMSGEQNWIKSAVTGLDALLIGLGHTGHRYASVGFSVGSGPGLTRVFDVGGAGTPFGTVAQFQGIGYSTSGGTEDGWAGIDVANGLGFRPEARRNYILVTDEDRDNSNRSLDYTGTLNSLLLSHTQLNSVVNASFECGGVRALGVGKNMTGYIADGSGSYTECAGARVISGYGTTVSDYVNLALDSGGAAWDLNLLRAGGLSAQSFTAAFTEIKVAEITSDTPEPSTWITSTAALAVVAAIRFRRGRRRSFESH